MIPEEIIKLAQTEKKLLQSELDYKLFELKALDWRILECIMFVKTNQNCSLQEAKTIVLESKAWIDKRDEFVNHQQEQMEEFLDAAKNDIQEIQQTFSTTKNDVMIFSLKNKKNL